MSLDDDEELREGEDALDEESEQTNSSLWLQSSPHSKERKEALSSTDSYFDTHSPPHKKKETEIQSSDYLRDFFLMQYKLTKGKKKIKIIPHERRSLHTISGEEILLRTRFCASIRERCFIARRRRDSEDGVFRNIIFFDSSAEEWIYNFNNFNF